MKLTICKPSGQVICVEERDLAPEFSTELICAENFENPFFDFQRNIFYEGLDTPSRVDHYRAKIYNVYEMLYASSLARALGKTGQGLSIKQLENLQNGYTQKKEVAERYLHDGTIANNTLFDTVIFEEATDFTGEKLEGAVGYFNAVYGANIPEEITRIQKYCYIILVKYRLGLAYWDVLISYCESFRSMLLTNLDNLEFDKIDTRIELSKTITNATSLEEIQILKTQFDAI